ncbi:cbb3-type cytochrome c oxidase N-terminal domain-containing protein [Rhodopirellula halodulae]|uniref:cbb3-type cytochrome c oxidase N-terminal domain-containing protein n=1 Tax=Rhodopirellula halodulae TaxID=2894198 RepID=UPI001E473A9A|nr:cbb3-type cytochrome c oxidase N-terminal domain-containing protein [Rhodopirellula sp. JC737]MCC9657896.1 c-type cytochrome [Rhodopirellula sp. JC737]
MSQLTDYDNAPKTDHAYDGIEEFDNPLPGWWKWLFIATIFFSPFYYLYYHSGASGRSVEDTYGIALAENTRLQFAEIGDLKPTEPTLVAYMHKPNWVRVGQSVFKANCISCHGREGEGQVGPNLTDEYFKNVKSIEDIAKVVNNGAGGGAMPKWSDRLHPNEVVLVSAYVASLRGQNIESSRGPEGGKIPPWPEPIEEDEETPEE